jgi:hypothetical protein
MEVGVATQSSDCKQKRSLFPCLFFPFFLDNTRFSSTSISYYPTLIPYFPTSQLSNFPASYCPTPTYYFPARTTIQLDSLLFNFAAFQLFSLLLPYPNFLLSNFLLPSANNYPALIKFVKHTVSNFGAFQLSSLLLPYPLNLQCASQMKLK